jgi:hypothetical protein
VSSQDEAIRRALGALRAEADDIDAHPGIEMLEAYVDGRLSPAERASIEALAARSPIVAEDLADLRAVREGLPVTVARKDIRWGRKDIRWGHIAAGFGIAASLTLAVWTLTRPSSAPETAAPVAASPLTAGEQARVDAAIAAGRVETPAVALIRPQGTLLNAPDTARRFGPLGPVGTYVRSPRPLFTWSDAGADAYTVAVFNESFSEVARSPRVTGTSWTPEVELPAGVVYVWQVTAHRGTIYETQPRPPQPEARFAVLEAAAVARVEQQAARLADQPLALGILFADAGLMAEARTQLARAAKIPASAEAARRLLNSLDQPSTAR